MKVVLVLLLAINLFALTPSDVYNIAKQYTDYPSWIVGIAGTESTFGKNILGDDGQSLGTMQIQVPTARYIAKRQVSILALKAQ